MAGDWFPMGLWRSRCPEVIAISSATGRSQHEVLGLLCDLWSWASSESVDGYIRGVRLQHLPGAVCADYRFWQAVAAAGWLAEDDFGIVIPNWQVWLSESMKKRAKARDRKRRQRAKCHTNVTPVSRSGHACPRVTETETEYIREDAIASSCSEPAKPPTSEPPVMTFPTVGRGAKEWNLTPATLAEFAEAYPAVDALAECRKALAWVKSNPTKAKTARGMPRFLNSWLSRSQDRGGPESVRAKSNTPKSWGQIQDEYVMGQLFNISPEGGNDDEQLAIEK